MLYFDHSTGAANDPKIMRLRLEHGGAAVDAYWYLIEQMHRDEQPLCVCNANVMRVHCHTLCTDISTLEKWVEAMVEIDLFSYDESGDFIYSERTMENVEKYQIKQQKARSAAESRWSNADAKQTHKRKQCKRNADAMPTKQNKTNSSNAIKSITTTSSSAAAEAAKATPTAEQNDETRSPHCPLCDSLLRMTITDGAMSWVCDCIGAIKDESVVWR